MCSRANDVLVVNSGLEQKWQALDCLRGVFAWLLGHYFSLGREGVVCTRDPCVAFQVLRVR